MVQKNQTARCVFSDGKQQEISVCSNGKKKVLARHQSEAKHKAGVHALQHTSCLPGVVTVSTEVHESMADLVCNQKVCVPVTHYLVTTN